MVERNRWLPAGYRNTDEAGSERTDASFCDIHFIFSTHVSFHPDGCSFPECGFVEWSTDDGTGEGNYGCCTDDDGAGSHDDQLLCSDATCIMAGKKETERRYSKGNTAVSGSTAGGKTGNYPV